MIPNPRPELELAGLLGEPEEVVRGRLGEPAVARSVGLERWLVYERAGTSLRLRLAPVQGSVPVARSWTAAFEPGHISLDAACRAVGVTPAPGDAPDDDSASERPGGGMLRRPLHDSSAARIHSLTAHTRGGRVRSLTAFDEPPDWRSGPERP